VDKAPPDDQEVPLYSSVQVPFPKAKAAFCVPAPANSDLAVINAPPTDQIPEVLVYCNSFEPVSNHIFPAEPVFASDPIDMEPVIEVL
jgi:hypothetical protein